MISHLFEFSDRRGFYNFKKGFVPYQFHDGTMKLLAVRPGYQFTSEQLAVSAWSMPVFNKYLADFCRSTHILLRLDRCPLGYEGELCSHVISAIYDSFRRCFWLQDTNKLPTALLQEPQDLRREWIQMSPEVMILLSDCFRLTIYEFFDPKEPKRTAQKIEEGVFKVFEALRKNPKGLTLGALHSLQKDPKFQIKAKWEDHAPVRFADSRPFMPGYANPWLYSLLADYKVKVGPPRKPPIACEDLE